MIQRNGFNAHSRPNEDIMKEKVLLLKRHDVEADSAYFMHCAA
jgi:hypothetical protein